MSAAPFRSLRGRIALALVAMFVGLTALFLVVTRFVASNEMRRFVLSDVYARHEEIGDGLVMLLDEVNLLYSRMVLSEEFTMVLQAPEINVAERQLLFQRMMGKVGVNRDLIGEVAVYFDGEWFQMNPAANFPIPGEAHFLQTILTSNRLLEQGSVLRDGQEAYLAIGKRMVNFPTGNVTGAVVFLIPELAIRRLAQGLSPVPGFSLIVSDGEWVISDTRGEYTGARILDASTLGLGTTRSTQSRILEGERFLTVTSSLLPLSERYGLDWSIVSTISQDALFQDVWRLDRYNLILGLVIAASASVFSFSISTRLSSRINRIAARLRRFSATGEKERAPGAVKDELWELEKTYDEMVDRIRALIRTIEEKAETQRKLELDALQMQINPHFLYNSLDAIAWMAKLKDEPEIARLSTALARFFRTSLHRGEKLITVADEIDLVRNFLAIELIRFPDKFDIHFDVDPDVERELTLKLILQPIVENAIKHGVSLLDGKGRITIKAYGDAQSIWFEVIDDGVGFDPPEDLLNRERLRPGTGGYGLINVDERIKLEYGPGYGIELFSEVAGGTRVVVKIRRSSAASSSAAG